MKKFKPLDIAPWAKAEQRRKFNQELRADFFLRVRLVFVLLLVATILVFIHNHQVEIQRIAAEKLNLLAKRSIVSDKLREKALTHENEVNQIAQPGQQPAPQPSAPKAPTP